MALLTVADALARLLADASPLAPETVSVMDASGRILAAPLSATLTAPPFDASAMDGYAVRLADVERLPARLSVVGEAAAGRGYIGHVGALDAVRIFTGAPMPAGTDAVHIQENCSRDGSFVIINAGSAAPGHVRPRGGDFVQGQTLLAADTVMTARRLTLAAAMGHAAIPVYRRPTVAILASGDELVLPGVTPGPDQIVCSNPFGVAALVTAAGGLPLFLGIAGDTHASLDAAIDRATGCDLLITIGGASVGDHDLIGPVLQKRGMALDFWKIAMRPGKPMLFGRLGTQRVVGLPGNPVSSLICARVFLVPLIERLSGRSTSAQRTIRTIAATDLDANGERTHYMRATLDVQGSQTLVRPVRSQDSSLLSPLSSADCLIVRPVGAPAVVAGQTIDVLSLDF